MDSKNKNESNVEVEGNEVEPTTEEVKSEEKKEKKGKKKWLLLLLLLISLVAGGLYYYKNSDFLGFDNSAEKYEGKIKEPKEWSTSRVAFPAFKSVRALEGSETLYIALVNPSFNEANIQFTVSLDGVEEPLLVTKLVRPGEAVKEVQLPKDLKAGVHKIRLKMRAFAPGDDSIELSGTETDFDLTLLTKEETEGTTK